MLLEVKKNLLGKQIEALAVRYLEQHQLQLLTKNFRTRFGEIDLIFEELTSQQIVFVEVRYRRSLNFGPVASSVNKLKQQKLIKTAKIYINQGFQDLARSYRFDIFACQGPLTALKIDWLINAFY